MNKRAPTKNEECTLHWGDLGERIFHSTTHAYLVKSHLPSEIANWNLLCLSLLQQVHLWVSYVTCYSRRSARILVFCCTIWIKIEKNACREWRMCSSTCVNFHFADEISPDFEVELCRYRNHTNCSLKRLNWIQYESPFHFWERNQLRSDTVRD